MSLAETMQRDLVEAMKKKDSVRVSVLRMVKAAFQNKKIELRKPLSAEDEIQILQTLVKQRNESIETFERAGRSDLVAKETEEREIIRTYLPEAVSEEEIERVVVEAIATLGASSPKEMGAVMKEALNRLKATGKTVDGKAVNAVVRSKLS